MRTNFIASLALARELEVRSRCLERTSRGLSVIGFAQWDSRCGDRDSLSCWRDLLPESIVSSVWRTVVELAPHEGKLVRISEVTVAVALDAVVAAPIAADLESYITRATQTKY